MTQFGIYSFGWKNAPCVEVACRRCCQNWTRESFGLNEPARLDQFVPGPCSWNRCACPDLSHVIFREVSRRPSLSLRFSAWERSQRRPQLSSLRPACGHSTAPKWGMEGNPEFDWREPRDSNCGLPVTSSTRDALISRRVPSGLVNGAAINHVPHVPKAPAQGTAQPSQNGILLSG